MFWEKLKRYLEKAKEEDIECMRPQKGDHGYTKGYWIHKETKSYAGGGATFCSECGYGYSDQYFFEVDRFNYCPNCGKKMKVAKLK